MFNSFVLLAIGVASFTSAIPVTDRLITLVKRNTPDINDVVLNYALTLEHLENAFYRDNTPSMDDFTSAGYGTFVYNRFVEIGGHEKSHVNFLSTALGKKATQECTYDFGVTDVPSFLATAQLLEGVGVSAYLGAAQNITEPEYVTIAGSILTTEARHSAWVQSVANNQDPFGAAYDTPIDFSQAYSLAAPLIVSCPKSNPSLPVVAFPAASFSPVPTKRLQKVTIVSDKLNAKKQKVGFISGTGSVSFASIDANNQVTLPDAVTWGRTYAVLVKKESSTITDDNTVAGPIPFDITVKSAVAAAYYSGMTNNIP